MNDPPSEFTDFERRLSKLLDGEGEEELRDLTPTQKRDLSQWLLIHSLIEQTQPKHQRQTREALDRVLANLPDEADEVREVSTEEVEPTSSAPAWWRWQSVRWSSAIAIAAGILLAVMLNWSTTPRSQAETIVQQSLQVVQQPQPRVYDVQIHARRPVVGDVDVEAKLYISGKDQFVLIHPHPLGGEVKIGCDGQNSWVVPPRGRVILRHDRKLLGLLFPQTDLNLPMLHLHTMMERFAEDYQLRLLPSETEMDGNRSFRRVHGERTEQFVWGPDSIDLWANPANGNVERLVLRWDQEVLLPDGRKVTFTLSESEPLPENWFEHQTHHEPQRPVTVLPFGSETE